MWARRMARSRVRHGGSERDEKKIIPRKRLRDAHTAHLPNCAASKRVVSAPRGVERAPQRDHALDDRRLRQVCRGRGEREGNLHNSPPPPVRDTAPRVVWRGADRHRPTGAPKPVVSHGVVERTDRPKSGAQNIRSLGADDGPPRLHNCSSILDMLKRAVIGRPGWTSMETPTLADSRRPNGISHPGGDPPTSPQRRP